MTRWLGLASLGLRARVFNVQYSIYSTAKDRTKNQKKTKHICERSLLSLSQDSRDADVSGRCENTVKWLHTRVGNPCIGSLAHRNTQIDTDMQQTQTTKGNNNMQQHLQIYLSPWLCILFLVLLVSMLPGSCRGGTYADAYSQSRPNPNPAPYII